VKLNSGQTGTLAAAVLTALALSVTPIPATANPPSARAAGSIHVSDEGKLHLVKSSGSTLIDEGHANGTIPGTVKIHFTYNGNPTVSAQITIYSHDGAINASGSGQLSNPNSPVPSFKGSLRISGGSGHYSHAHGNGDFYGLFYRRSYAITVQTQGTLDY